MGTSFGQALIHSLLAIAPQEQTERVNIWKYDAPEYFLRPVTDWPSPFVLEKSYEHNPAHEFEIKYFSRPNENPVRNSIPVKISARNGEVIGLCGLSVSLLVPDFNKTCIDKWTFSKREDGGFYIKPFNDPLLCMNAYGPGIRVETCRTDWPSMGFMYGDRKTRENFLILKDLLEITHDEKTKKDLKNILDTGEYMYDPPDIEKNTLLRNTAQIPERPKSNENPPRQESRNLQKKPTDMKIKENLKKPNKIKIEEPTDETPSTHSSPRRYRRRRILRRRRLTRKEETDHHRRKNRQTTRIHHRRTKENDEMSDPYVRRSTMLKYISKIKEEPLDSTVIDRLKEIVSKSSPSPLYSRTREGRDREVENILNRLDRIQKKAQTTLLDQINCDVIFCPADTSDDTLLGRTEEEREEKEKEEEKEETEEEKDKNTKNTKRRRNRSKKKQKKKK